jgi:hypothetical protein
MLPLIYSPQEFGTPQQDADRRDLTINALFYNINTREVEDFTGKVTTFSSQAAGYSTSAIGN